MKQAPKRPTLADFDATLKVLDNLTDQGVPALGNVRSLVEKDARSLAKNVASELQYKLNRIKERFGLE